MNKNDIELIKFDLEMSNICSEQEIKDLVDVTAYNSLLGGARSDSENILRYLNNSKNIYAKSFNSLNGKKYIFKLLEDKNNKEFIYSTNIKSKYIGAGFYSTAMAIKLKYTDDNDAVDKFRNEILVLKVLGVKKNFDNGVKRSDKFFQDWNYRFYKQYEKDKKTYGVLLANIYFYGDNVYNSDYFKELVREQITDQPKDTYHKFINDKKLCFNISKYYHSPKISNMTSDSIKQFILKMVSVIFYLSKKNTFINDFKYDNIACDNYNNFICIDYDVFNPITFYKFVDDNGKYKYVNFGLATTIPVHVRKKIYSLFKNEVDIIKSIRATREKVFDNNEKNNLIEELKESLVKLKKNINIMNFFNKYDDKTNKNNNLDKIFLRISLNSLRIENLFVLNVINKNAGENYNLGMSKFDCLGIFQVLMTMFFAPFESIEPKNGGGGLKSIMFGHTIKNNVGMILELNKLIYQLESHNHIFWLSAFQTLNDIDKINKIVNEFLEPLYPDNPIIVKMCNDFRKLFFDNDSETGLLAPEYNDIPSFDLVFKYLVDVFNYLDNKDYNNLIIKLLRENIFSDIDIDFNITSKTYNEWICERKHIKTTSNYALDEMNYEMNNEIDLIPTNTKFHNYYYNLNKQNNDDISKIQYDKNESFKNKYLKYKNKYLNLKNLLK